MDRSTNRPAHPNPTPTYFAEIARRLAQMAEEEQDPERKRKYLDLADLVERDWGFTYDALTGAAGFAELGLHSRLDRMAQEIAGLKVSLQESKEDRGVLHEGLEKQEENYQESRKDRAAIRQRLEALEQGVGELLALMRSIEALAAAGAAQPAEGGEA